MFDARLTVELIVLHSAKQPTNVDFEIPECIVTEQALLVVIQWSVVVTHLALFLMHTPRSQRWVFFQLHDFCFEGALIFSAKRQTKRSHKGDVVHE